MANNRLTNIKPTRRPGLFNSKPVIDIGSNRLKAEVNELSKKFRIIEEKVDNVTSHLALIDNSVVEKHKLSMTQINDLKAELRNLRSSVNKFEDMANRLIKRNEGLASREEVKILQRYVDLWQPLNYVTRSEVEAIVKSILNDKSIKKKKT